MASTNSVLYELQKSTRVKTSRLPAPNQAGGAVQMAVVPCVLGAGALNDTINLCKLPVGAIPIPALSFVLCDDAGVTLTMDVGTAEDADMMAAGLDLATAGKKEFASTAAFPAVLTPVATASQDIIATVASSTTPSATAKLVFHIAYKVPA